MQLEGSVCVLTGATGGIGVALAGALAAAGTKLIIAARDRRKLQGLADRLIPGAVTGLYAGDLTCHDNQRALAELAATRGAAILINLAGVNRFGLLRQQCVDAAPTLIRTNLIAPVELTHRLLPHFLRQEQAMVVNIGSAFGAIGYPGYTLYSASKFGLRGFSEALARELADGPVRVLYVAPRATQTTMNTAAARALNSALGNAEDTPTRVAAQIVRAILKHKPRSAIGWPERVFCRLNQVVPGLMDRAIARQLPRIKRHASTQSTEDNDL
jgi:short-subunit dehydrogenase